VLPYSIQFLKFNIKLLTQVHEQVIVPVERQKISVDEGFSKAVSTLYGVNTYLSLTYSEKFNYLLELSYITYTITSENLDSFKTAQLFGDSFLNVMNTPN